VEGGDGGGRADAHTPLNYELILMINSSERYQRMRDVYETCVRVRRGFGASNEPLPHELLTPVVLDLQESLLKAETCLPYGESHGGYVVRDRYDDVVRSHVLQAAITVQRTDALQPRPLWRLISVEEFMGNMYDRDDYTLLWRSSV
jgi:hypothetical protein